MEFEEMQVIWNTQEREPMFAYDRESVHKLIRSKSVDLDRGFQIVELVMIGVFGVLGIASISEPLIERHDWHQLIGGTVALLISGWFLKGRIERRRLERDFPDSIRGDLDRALTRVDFQTSRLQSVFWWYVVPSLITTGISFAFVWRGKPVWIWPLSLLAILIVWRTLRLDVEKRLKPVRRELQSFRDLLDEAETLSADDAATTEHP